MTERIEKIKQEKSNKEIIDAENKIIDSLTDFNLAEKYKILKCLYLSVSNLIKKYGIIIEYE